MFFYRAVSILMTKIDTDKLPTIMENIEQLNEKILKHYSTISHHSKFSFFEGTDSFYQFSISLILVLLKHGAVEDAEIVAVKNGSYLFTNENFTDSDASEQTLAVIKKIIKTFTSLSNESNYTLCIRTLLPFLIFFSFENTLWQSVRTNEVDYFLSCLADKATKITDEAHVGPFEQHRIYPVEQMFIDVSYFSDYFILNEKKEMIRARNGQAAELENYLLFIDLVGRLKKVGDVSEEAKKKFTGKRDLAEKEIIHETKDTKIIELKKKENKEKPLIILDGPNVGMRYGSEQFNSDGIKIAIEFFNRNGHKVLVVIPDYFLKESTKSDKKNSSPADREYLESLIKQDILVKVPSFDYDDSYCIHLAKSKNAFVVTNDMYRDMIGKARDGKEKKTEINWVRNMCISLFFN